MKIIYNEFIKYLGYPRVLPFPNGGIKTVHFLDQPYVDAVAVLKSSIADATIEYSPDNISWFVVAQNVAIDINGTVVSFPGISNAKHWRISNNGTAGTIGLVYPGKTISLKCPKLGSTFADSVVSSDRTSERGVEYSRILYQQKSGNLELRVEETEEPLFREVYDKSKGFRIPTVLEVPNLTTPCLIKHGVKYPLVKSLRRYWTGEWAVKEAI